MSVWSLPLSIAGHHLIPSILASLVVFIALWAIFRWGRVRRPADRVLFLYVVILKAGLAALAGSGVSCLAYHRREFGYFGLRFPDVVPDGVLSEAFTVEFLVQSTVVGPVFVAVLALSLMLLVYRWGRISPVYRSVYESRRAGGKEVARLLGVFEQLADRACAGRRWSPRPRLLVTHSAPLPAFCMGVRAPVIVMSARVVRELGERELKGILAHELGHVRRMDYLGRWIATILRDVMIWNPFVVHWYNRLLDEQEAAGDDYATELLGDPAAVASGLVEVTAHARHLPVVSSGAFPALRLDRSLSKLHERLDRLERTTAEPHQRTRWSSVLVYGGLFAFFAAQPEVSASLPNLVVIALRVFWDLAVLPSRVL